MILNGQEIASATLTEEIKKEFEKECQEENSLAELLQLSSGMRKDLCEITFKTLDVKENLEKEYVKFINAKIEKNKLEELLQSSRQVCKEFGSIMAKAEEIKENLEKNFQFTKAKKEEYLLAKLLQLSSEMRKDIAETMLKILTIYRPTKDQECQTEPPTFVQYIEQRDEHGLFRTDEMICFKK